MVTILFADLASFTAASEKVDPEDVIDMLNQVFTRLMVECDREGGYLDKTVGDQLMVLFGAPRAHEDDPARAVRAALGMQKAIDELAPIMREKVGAACKINIGINTGPVVWGRMGPFGRAVPTVIGDAVNLASRLQHFASGGQIVVSETVYLQTRRFFEYEVLEPIQVKGKTGLIPVYMPLRQRQAVKSSKRPVEGRHPLIERDQELQSLHAYWSRALAGYMQLVLVTGEAGIGKSRLLTHFLEDLDTYANQKQPLILHARNESALDSGYSPLMELLRQLFALTPDDTTLTCRRKIEDRAQILGITSRNFLPLMGYLLGWYQNNTRLADPETNLDHLSEAAIDAAIDLFYKQSQHRPTLLILDDLQWADAGTRHWLHRLVILKQMIQNERLGYGLIVILASRTPLDLPTGSID
ncbi:MAG: adenylate/guanylate cyclase domain-containing protein, partial [Chloroflexota bacterium]